MVHMELGDALRFALNLRRLPAANPRQNAMNELLFLALLKDVSRV